MQRVSDSTGEETFLLQAGYGSHMSSEAPALMAAFRWMGLS